MSREHLPEVSLMPHLHKLTLLGEALREALETREQPVITPYELFQEMRKLYKSGRKLWLRNPVPDEEDLERMRLQLRDAKVLTPDRDFKVGVYRIIANGDRPAEEICGIVEPSCYISHLSAMARYGLTDRRPAELHLTMPDLKTVKQLWNEVFEKDYSEDELNTLSPDQLVKPSPRTVFPKKVRGQQVRVTRTAHPGASTRLRGGYARIATVGQVFSDMLEDPDACGGMKHVMEVWEEHATSYLNEIVEAVDTRPKKITKVRAGYLLDEFLGASDPRVESWVQYAQRGGSSLLNPSAEFESEFSEKWMLSLNVN